MRFRAKFALIDWAWLAIAAFVLVLLLSGPRRAKDSLVWYGFLILLFAAIRVVLYFFLWWDTTPGGLRERRLWSTRTIPWTEITGVAPWPDGQAGGRAHRDSLAIEYARAAPLSDQGRLIANPADREGFLREVRRHAPQASFEVTLGASPVPGR